jgi:sugar lactone lactonase YvrE
VWPLAAKLGEGPVWCAPEAALWFVDIKSKQIHRFDPVTDTKQSWNAPDQVSFVLPRDDGGYVTGLPGKLAGFDSAMGKFEAIHRIESSLPDNRTNDACIDAVGRLWFDTMDDRQVEPNGALYSWDGAGAPVVHDRGYIISNGPAFSPDGRTLYHTDTVRRTIYRFDVAPNGSVSGKRNFVEIEDGDGAPDGSVVDAEGCVWVALYGGWGVRRYSPKGELLQAVSFPCANVTKIAFGGSNLKTAFATTAAQELTTDELANQPLAGGLFAFDVDVPGIEQKAMASA